MATVQIRKTNSALKSQNPAQSKKSKGVKEAVDPSHVRWIVGKNMRFLRQVHGVTQNQLADTLGVFQASISRIEQGAQELSIAELITLSVFFDVPLELIATQDLETLGGNYKPSEFSN